MTQIRNSVCALVIALLVRDPAAAADTCSKPRSVGDSIVDGTTATIKQMNQAQQSYATYLTLGRLYQTCLAKGPLPERLREQQWDAMQNEMEREAALYNREVRRFKQRTVTASGSEPPVPVDLR